MMEPRNGMMLDASKLCFNGEFEYQVYKLLQDVRLTREEVDNLQILLDDLQTILNIKWPGCVVQPFGSIVTGLGIKTSDIDCFVRLPVDVEITNNLVFIAKNHLRRFNMFGDLVAIANAKVPIVKFLYYPTNRYCDINFTSCSGVRNSNLLAFYLNIDRKILELCILIKYWSKVHKLTGTYLLSSYSLTLLVIFYLQQKKLVPPVFELQHNIHHHFVDGWDTAFQMPKVTILNSESLYDMMGGFFKYYSMFDFDELIVSPFLGHPVRKVLFRSVDDAPDEYALYKYNLYNKECQMLRTNTKICIQDPFEHNRNCSVALTPKLIKKLLLHMSFAADRYGEEANNFLEAILVKAPDFENHPDFANDVSSPRGNRRAGVIPKRNILNNRIAKNKKKPKLMMLYREFERISRQRRQ